ncbi:MAG: hypothetical protein CMA00_001340 [Methanobacteriota archaeon]|nr:MAG: hypothetical protein CMA00_001340 [Euryarchaeota archaeon]|tara:strand:- start:17749 stop:18651 length:903 start_codon:yes stop_codon:yes gene_type:complete
MGGVLRVIILDLLVERSEFGHGGNQEIIAPLAEELELEVLLLTPQMQSSEVGEESQKQGVVKLAEKDVPGWDYEFPFWEEAELGVSGNKVTFRRIAMPLHGNDKLTKDWISRIRPSAVVCSGSRRNVSIWEEWMGGAESLLRCSAKMGIPTLGICFGHQLLCHSLGSLVERAETMSSGVWDVELTQSGESDILFSSRRSGNGGSPVALYSHQDHVMTVPECCTLLGSAKHNVVTAVRVNDEMGLDLPAWGVQFHPEAAKARVERAFGWGHITKEELDSFKREHDGAGVLKSFASVVLSNH